MSEREKIKAFDWSKLDEAFKAMPPEIRSRIEVPLRASSPRVFLLTLRNLRDTLDNAIKHMEEVVGDNPSTDLSTGRK